MSFTKIKFMVIYIQQRSTKHLLCDEHFRSHYVATHHHHIYMSLDIKKCEYNEYLHIGWWGEVERDELHCNVT